MKEVHEQIYSCDKRSKCVYEGEIQVCVCVITFLSMPRERMFLQVYESWTCDPLNFIQVDL